MAKLTLNNIASGYASATALDANFTAIETALENTLSRDGTSPNTMSADLDLNGNGILNVGSLTVGGVDITTLVDDAVAAAASAAAALVSETNAAASEVAAEAAASEVVDWEYAGTWTNNTPYLKNNIVYSSTLGDSYVCLTTHTSNAAGTISDDIANWGLLALHASVAGVGDMFKSDNLAGLANYGIARSNMGLTIGTHVQAYDADLAAIAALTTTSFGRGMLEYADAATAFSALKQAASETATGVVEIATDAEAQAFTANKAIDGAKLNTALQGANQSLAASGYQKLPGGLIIQWGSTAFADFAGTASVSATFPLTFPTAVLGIVDAVGLTGGFNTAVAVTEGSITTSGFSATVAEWNAVAQSGGKYRWIALGY